MIPHLFSSSTLGIPILLLISIFAPLCNGKGNNCMLEYWIQDSFGDNVTLATEKDKIVIRCTTTLKTIQLMSGHLGNPITAQGPKTGKNITWEPITIKDHLGEQFQCYCLGENKAADESDNMEIDYYVNGFAACVDCAKSGQFAYAEEGNVNKNCTTVALGHKVCDFSSKVHRIGDAYNSYTLLLQNSKTEPGFEYLPTLCEGLYYKRTAGLIPKFETMDDSKCKKYPELKYLVDPILEGNGTTLTYELAQTYLVLSDLRLSFNICQSDSSEVAHTNLRNRLLKSLSCNIKGVSNGKLTTTTLDGDCANGFEVEVRKEASASVWKLSCTLPKDTEEDCGGRWYFFLYKPRFSESCDREMERNSSLYELLIPKHKTATCMPTSETLLPEVDSLLCPPPSSTPSTTATKTRRLSPGIIAVVTVACVCLVVLIVLVVIFHLRQKKNTVIISRL